MSILLQVADPQMDLTGSISDLILKLVFLYTYIYNSN
jgi:hypothetical protein